MLRDDDEEDEKRTRRGTAAADAAGAAGVPASLLSDHVSVRRSLILRRAPSPLLHPEFDSSSSNALTTPPAAASAAATTPPAPTSRLPAASRSASRRLGLEVHTTPGRRPAESRQEALRRQVRRLSSGLPKPLTRLPR